MGSKAISSVLGKKLIDEGVKQIPNLYRYRTSKIKNKNIQWAPNSDIAKYVVEETQNKAKNKLNNLFDGVYKMSKGIINFQIENAIKDMDDEDVNNNFLGVFPTNHINKFINHAATISEKKYIPSL